MDRTGHALARHFRRQRAGRSQHRVALVGETGVKIDHALGRQVRLKAVMHVFFQPGVIGVNQRQTPRVRQTDGNRPQAKGTMDMYHRGRESLDGAEQTGIALKPEIPVNNFVPDRQRRPLHEWPAFVCSVELRRQNQYAHAQRLQLGGQPLNAGGHAAGIGRIGIGHEQGIHQACLSSSGGRIPILQGRTGFG